MSQAHVRRGWARWAVLIAVLALLATACSSDMSDTFEEVATGLDSGGEAATDTTTAAADAASDDGERRAREPADDTDELGSGGIEPITLQASDLGRDIIYTADITVAVTDVASAGEEATRVIRNLGGFLFGQRSTGSPEARSILTFKIQPENFQEALSRLGEIGEIRTQNVTADDVTERIVDLESRISTAAASVDRLRTLLSEATDIESIVELESELLARETELETLRGSLRTLENQVALATIVLTLTEAATRPAMDVDVSAYPAHDDGNSCPGSGELVVDEGSEATVCVEITNAGDTWLADFEVRDPVLDIELDDMTVVFGDPSRPIEPGESILLAHELEPDRNLRTRTTVTATPVDENGETLPGRPASSTVTMFVGAADPGGIPGFGDGLEASWDLLVRIGQLLVLIAGAVIPFLWVPLLAWFAWRTWRSRSPVAAAKSESETV